MKLNDKESYMIKESLLESAYKGRYEVEKTITSGDGLREVLVEKTGDISFTITLQINRRPHMLYYDNEKTRNKDYDLIASCF